MNFLRILWWFVRKRGAKSAWRRFKRGVYGYAHPRCRCGRWKGFTCTDLCRWCVYEPLMASELMAR